LREAATVMGKTLFEKIWDRHVVKDLGDGFGLIFVDAQMLTDLSSPQFVQLEERGLPLRFPKRTFAVSDHTVPTLVEGTAKAASRRNSWTGMMHDKATQFGVTHLDADDPDQGITSIVAPELAIVWPGSTFTVLDSHACTSGALGAMAWASTASDVLHTLATQTSILKKPPLMRISLVGTPGAGITAKDMMLHVLRELSIAGAAGYAVELAGPVIRTMPMEGRLTCCNVGVELGSRTVMIAPDNTTVEYLAGRRYAPSGADWDVAVRDWLHYASDDDAVFDRDVTIDVSLVEPLITWGPSPDFVIGISENVPNPADEPDAERRAALEAALAYTNLTPGAPIAGTPVDFVFIGSCANNRISDLRSAAAVAKGQTVAKSVDAWVIPGSQAVKRQAEEEGLDLIFQAAGFHWGEPGCSMCGGQGNGFTELLGPRRRAVSTIARNFPNRQGPQSITHVASPATAAAVAVAGHIVDVRKFAS
jgi:3-isopropylmalate/(R)-2-methylmalate dehydratase large subunit